MASVPASHHKGGVYLLVMMKDVVALVSFSPSIKGVLHICHPSKRGMASVPVKELCLSVSV